MDETIIIICATALCLFAGCSYFADHPEVIHEIEEEAIEDAEDILQVMQKNQNTKKETDQPATKPSSQKIN